MVVYSGYHKKFIDHITSKQSIVTLSRVEKKVILNKVVTILCFVWSWCLLNKDKLNFANS